MTNVTFTVLNETTVSNEVVVVQLQIAGPADDEIIHDWRVLTPAPGGSSRFIFAGQITVVVTDGTTTTPATGIAPGMILPIISVPNRGLTFGAPRTNASGSRAVGVLNDSTDPILLKVTWFVDSCALLLTDGLNQQSTASLELTSTFMFEARSGSIGSEPTAFELDPSLQAVTVTWTRNGPAGPDHFTFATQA